jgi:hypothetical protein
MSIFEQAHRDWLESHLQCRRGESKRRLQEGHNHAEKEFLRHVWWPAFDHFDYLHPEYEVMDYREGARFLDFAYIRPPMKIAIEVDGYGPHLRDISRRQFCDQWVRQMHLINDSWVVVRIGYDDIKERPRLWQQLFQQMIGRWFGDPGRQLQKIDCMEREVVRLGLRLSRPIKLKDVETELQCGYRYARKVMQNLVEKQWVVPTGSGTQRIHSWRLNIDNKHIPLY